MKDDNILFRKALNGYNKKDVNDYIRSLNAEFTRRAELDDIKSHRLDRDGKFAEEERLLAEKRAEELAFELFAAQEQIKALKERLEKADVKAPEEKAETKAEEKPVAAEVKATGVSNEIMPEDAGNYKVQSFRRHSHRR